MNKAPAFQFYPRDWMDFKVQRMSLAAQGAYIKILGFMWMDSPDQCSITSDPDALSKALGNDRSTTVELLLEIQHESDPIFVEKNGRFYSKRLKAEAEKQRKFRHQRKLAGEASAQRRFNKRSTSVERKSNSSSSSSSSISVTNVTDSAEPEILSFPVTGKERTWVLRETLYRQFCESYEHLPVMDEMRKALAWLVANPQRQKTTRGMGKFLVGWLNRAVDNGRYNNGNPNRQGTTGSGEEARYRSGRTNYEANSIRINTDDVP